MVTAEQIPANGCVVEMDSTEPDNMGRVKFTAYWADNYLPPSGVRGQVFVTTLEKFREDWERTHKGPVTVLA